MSIRRDQIVQAMVTRFKTVTVANGYHSNAGNNCSSWFEDPSVTYDQTEVPFINVRDTKDEIKVGTVGGLMDHRLTVEIDTSAFGNTADISIRQQIYDVYKAIGSDPYWGGLAIDTEPGSDEILADMGARKIVQAKITVTIMFRTGFFAES